MIFMALDMIFSSLKTPQQNAVVERKSRTLQEIGKTMLIEHDLPKFLWAEASNRLSIRMKINKTLYKIWHEKNLGLTT